MPETTKPAPAPKWSAGEWMCDAVGAHRFIHDEAGRTVAHLPPCPGISPQQRTANGKVIAQSKCMYAALERLWNAVKAYDSIGHEGSELLEAMSEAREALSDAREGL